MKKIATIFLLIFSFFLAVPAITPLLADQTVCFSIDEEKGEDGSESETKSKKSDYLFYHQAEDFMSACCGIAFHIADSKYTSPCIEMQTPPPDFC